MQAILHTTRGTGPRLEALTQFTIQHANAQSYTEYPTDIKRLLAEELSSLVEASISGSVVSAQELAFSLRTLRLLSREDLHMQSLHNVNAVKWTMKLGGLLEGVAPPISDNLVVEESLKCLVNIVVKAEILIEEFVKLGGHWEALKMLEDLLKKLQVDNGTTSATTEREIAAHQKELSDFNGRYENMLVPTCRLLFTVTRPVEKNMAVIQAIRDRKLLETICEFVFIFSYAIQQDKTIATRLSLTDLIRTVINLTVDLGALGSADIAALAQYIPQFPRLIHSMHRFLEIKSVQFKDPIYNLHMIAAGCFVNVPHDVAGAVLMQEDGQWPEPEPLASRIIQVAQTLCDVLSSGISLDTPRALVPLMMWMANLARGVVPIRKEFLRIMFPHRQLYEEVSQEGNAGVAPPGYEVACLGNAIIKHMTSIERAVKHWSNELLYIIVDEDADLFVRLTGFGNAAGLLVNRGLFGMGNLAQASSTTRADIEAMTGKPMARAPGSSSSSSGVPGAGSSSAPSSRGPTITEMADTEDEEEEKARQLMMKLEDMERRGLVKLVRKGDPQPGPDGTFPPKEPEQDKGSPSS